MVPPSLLRSTQIASDPSHTNQTGAPVQALQRIFGMRPDWERRPPRATVAACHPAMPAAAMVGAERRKVARSDKAFRRKPCRQDSTRSSHDKNHNAGSKSALVIIM